jgi:ATP-binding cassette subfamily B protein/subfamily B ATP-binding cassette protein MsbA
VLVLAVLSLAEVGFGALAPWPLKLVVDSVLGSQPLPAWLEAPVRLAGGGSVVGALLVIVFGGLVLQVTSQIVSAVHTQVQVTVGQGLVYDLRGYLVAHLQGLGLRHHVLTSTGDAVYRVEADAYCIDNLVMKGFFPLVSAIASLAVMFVVLLALDWRVALLSLAVLPFLFLTLRFYMTHLVDRAERVKMLESKVVERLYETFSAIKVIKSYAREVFELDRFMGIGATTMRERLSLTWQESLFAAAVSIITLAGTALVIVVGGLGVLDGRLTVGALLVVMAYLQAVYGPLSSIAYTSGSLQQAVASMRRVRAVFALPLEREDEPGRLRADGLRGHIRFDRVSFAYDADRPILEDISFEARPGEMIALVGLTGAGKTTLVNLIPRFYAPTTGRILVDGHDLRSYEVRSLRGRIAYVGQESQLFAGTVADNIRYGRLDATDAEVQAAARAAHAHDFVARLPHGYASELAEAGGTLSGGERQRLSVARALIKDAPILILDEPTSALDALSEELVFSALRRLRADRTTLVIAHRLSTIRDADTILVLDGGRIVARGRHEQLLASNDLYRQMCARLSVGRSLDDPESIDDLIEGVRLEGARADGTRRLQPSARERIDRSGQGAR